MDKAIVERRRAIEALRAGVPNRDVVRHLPPLQSDVDEKFEALLEAAALSWGSGEAPSGQPSSGLLLEGDFGSGKSHWLEHFGHLALEHRFVCSTVVLNKETPLHDAAKLYRACVASAVAPDKTGPALEEIAHAYHTERAQGFRELLDWTHSDQALEPRLAATLTLFEKSGDPEMRKRVAEEWAGAPMPVPELKAALRDIGEPRTYAVSRGHKMPPLLWFAFLTRFFRSAGYAGWVVLLDETEMVSKYSLRQRGRSYAHLAQLLGLARGAPMPGLATVFTITKDYAGQVLVGRKNDQANIPARLAGTSDEPLIAQAEAGMKAIRGKGLDLRAPSRAQVEAVYEQVRALYAQAYQWRAPEISRREYSSSTGMRQYVRSWINAWDLRRLYDHEADVVAESLAMSYDEDADMQTTPAEQPEEREQREEAEEADEPSVTF